MIDHPNVARSTPNIWNQQKLHELPVFHKSSLDSGVEKRTDKLVLPFLTDRHRKDRDKLQIEACKDLMKEM